MNIFLKVRWSQDVLYNGDEGRTIDANTVVIPYDYLNKIKAEEEKEIPKKYLKKKKPQ